MNKKRGKRKPLFLSEIPSVESCIIIETIPRKFEPRIDRFQSRLKLAHNIVGRDKVDRHYREHRGRMSQRLHGWEQKRAYLAESWATRTHTDAPLARMLWLHRRIRATTVYAACRARTARVELAAFDYAHLRRCYSRVASSGFCGISSKQEIHRLTNASQ